MEQLPTQLTLAGRDRMITTIDSVKNQSPEIWCRNPKNIYVGRDVILRTGKCAGTSWSNSGMGNPYRIIPGASHAEKRECLYRYAAWLSNALDHSPLLRSRFWQLPGKTLGCWCLKWDGLGPAPLCHAAWIAAILNEFLDPRVRAVSVNIEGEFRPWIELDPRLSDPVFKHPQR